VANWTPRLAKNGSLTTKRASADSRTKGCEGRFNLADRCGLEDLDLQPDGGGGLAPISVCDRISSGSRLLALIQLKTNADGDLFLLFVVLTVDQINIQAGRVSESIAHLSACFVRWPYSETIRYAVQAAIALG
jgi:hypothetical protein